MLTDNVYELFGNITTDPHVINSNEFVLLPHQVIPKYYVISESDVNKLILHYSLGSGKTATAVFVLLHYLRLYRMYDFMSHFARLDDNFLKRHRIKKNVIVVGAWQTQSQIETELLRPEFGIIKETDAAEMKSLLSSSIAELRTKGEEKRKHLIRTIDRDIRFCGYQSFFNLLFPTVKTDSYGQNTDSLIAELMEGNIAVSSDFLDSYRDSVIIIDEMQRLYSIDGLNSFGVAVMALSKLAKKYNIKIIFLTGTMINSSVRELVDIMNIMSDDKVMLQYDDYMTPTINRDGISIVKIKPERYDEVVHFFERRFMYYNQSSDKVVDIPQLLSWSDIQDMMTYSANLASGKSTKKAKTITGGDADGNSATSLASGIYSHITERDMSDLSDESIGELSSDSEIDYTALKLAFNFINNRNVDEDTPSPNANDTIVNNWVLSSEINDVANTDANTPVTSTLTGGDYYTAITPKIDTSIKPIVVDLWADDDPDLPAHHDNIYGDVNPAAEAANPTIPTTSKSTDNTDTSADTTTTETHPDIKLPYIGFNQIYIPEFVRADKKTQYLVFPKVDLIPQEIHVGNTPLNTTTSLQPMIIYAVQTEGYQAKAYAQYIKNHYNQANSAEDDAQQSENTIYIQDAYVPPTEEWMKFGIIKDASGNLYGKFLHKDNLRQFSAIGYEMLNLCLDNALAGEKSIIYHNKLNAFGINQYALILQYNGFVRYGQNPTDKAICKECGQTYADHHQSLEYRTTHRICNVFKPIVFAVLSGALQQFERDNLTNNVFNNPNNLYGDLISVMFVSDVAYSGVSFFNTNNIIILSRIPNISKWKQIYSRIIRTRSHMGLPQTKQYAKVYTMTIDYPKELQVYKPSTGLTVGSLYYKQREVANEDIKTVTQAIADTCVSSVLFTQPDRYKLSNNANYICNDLLKNDIKTNMKLILKRIMNDRLCHTWIVASFIRRIKDPFTATSFMNLRPIDKDIIVNIVNETRMVDLFTFEKTSNLNPPKLIKYHYVDNSNIVNETTFDVAELGTLKLASLNIKNLLKKLDTDTSMAAVVNHIARILKLCKKNYMPIVNSLAFWEQMYNLGNEYYDDDDKNFLVNHTRKGRNKARYTGCYYGNEIILRDGTSKVINYKFPMAKLKPNLPYMYKITCLVVSENSPFYIHVNIVRYNKDNTNDRRKINKGVICTSAPLEDIYTIFPNIDKSLPKKQYCKELMFEVCELQTKHPDYKFVYTPFEK